MLDLSRFTQHVTIRDPWAGTALQMLEDAVNRLAKSVGASPVGETPAPAPVQQLNVKVSGEMAHAVITDNNPVNRNVHYFLEYANEPNFLQPHVEHLGTSRGRVIPLPTNDDSGTPHQWYFRAYSQYPGSKPSPHVAYGGVSPQPVIMNPNGTTTTPTSLTLQPSTGSGTAQNNGQQGGYGFGKFQSRPAPRPKRSVQT